MDLYWKSSSFKQKAKNLASSQLNSLYDEIRPAIEEHERDSQDSVSTSVAEKWIEASCSKLKAEFDFYSSIIKQVSIAPRRPHDVVPLHEGENEIDMKYLEMGGVIWGAALGQFSFFFLSPKHWYS